MTIPTYLDAVEQGRIPADEIAHETRIARTAFKLALAEAAAVARDEGGAEIHALHIEQHFRFREALGIDKHEGDSDWMDDPPDLLKSTSAMRNGYDTLIVLTSHVVARAVAEAVRVEREAIASALARQVDAFDSSETTDYRDGWHMASRAALKMVRSRPSPDVAVVPQIFDERTFEHRFVVVAREMVAEHDRYARGSHSSDAFCTAMLAALDVAKAYLSFPPPDLAAMRRVVEAARQYRYDCENSDINAIERAQKDLFDLVGEVVRADARAQEADHDR